jgi:hypothetical protein
MKRLLAWALPAVLAAVLAPFLRTEGGDAWLFVRAGKTMLSGDWSHTFATSEIQAGPLQLLLFGTVGRSPALLAALLAATAALLLTFAVRSLGVERSPLLALAGALAVATGLTTHVFDAGHPADGLLPLLWIIAAADARRGKTWRAASIVGLSAGFETWGVLGVAVLAFAPSVRDALRAVPVAVGVATALFLPFVVAGEFAMLSYHWLIMGRSLLGHIVEPGTSFGWPLRLAQGGLAVAAGAGVARVARRSPHALWLVPLVIVLVRIALDPMDSGYYFDGVQAAALAGLVVVAARGLRVPTGHIVRQPVA